MKFKYSKIWNEYVLLSKRYEELKVFVFYRYCIYFVSSYFFCYYFDGLIYENDRYLVCGISFEGFDYLYYRE